MVKKKNQLCYGFQNLATEMAWITDGYTLMQEATIHIRPARKKRPGRKPYSVYHISDLVSSGYSDFYSTSKAK